MWYSTFQAALLGGLLCLDRNVLHIMISRPVVAGPIIGFSLGDPMTGLVAGAMIELLWIDRYPMGRYIPPNDTVVAVLVTAVSIMSGKSLGGPSPELIAAAVLIFAPVAFIARKGDVLVAESNDAISARVEEDARRGDSAAIARGHYFGMVKTYIMSSLLIFLFLVIGTAILEVFFPLLTERLLSALRLIYYFIPILGVSVALSTIKTRGALPVFSGVFLVVMILARMW
ncbi:MAG: PTS sugar transporter subunit IIC [Syntrophales bacterium]|nr:PTS sugar transporter subunit IIC [Syntrophales bacterium]